MALEYQLWTSPNPLATGEDATITLSIRDPDREAKHSLIVIWVPLGNDAADLSPDKPHVSLDAQGWAVATSGVRDGSELGLSAGVNHAIWRLQPVTPGPLPEPFEVTMTASPVNDVAGTVTYVVEPEGDPKLMANLPLRKVATGGLYLDNFVAVAGKQLLTRYDNGAGITFAWESNASSFELYAPGSADPIWKGTGTTCTLASGVAADTTFILVATGKAPTREGEPGDATRVLYAALTITVSNPDLKPKTVAASGAVTAASATVGATVTATDVHAANDVKAKGLHFGVAVGDEVKASGAVSGKSVTATGTVKASDVHTSGLVFDVGVCGVVNHDGTLTQHSRLDRYGFTCNSISSDSIASKIVQVAEGTTNAVRGFNASSYYAAGYFKNTQKGEKGATTGIYCQVAHEHDEGFRTNGRIVGHIHTLKGAAPVTQLETRDGERVATSPLSLAPEVHASGRSRLAGGRAVVELGPVADVIHHDEDHAYRVLVTPTGLCNGVAVVAKEAASFVAQELMQGTSDAEFDWFLVAHKRESLQGGPAGLPDVSPEPTFAPPPGASA